jgi:hypothetical protein
MLLSMGLCVAGLRSSDFLRHQPPTAKTHPSSEFRMLLQEDFRRGDLCFDNETRYVPITDRDINVERSWMVALEEAEVGPVGSSHNKERVPTTMQALAGRAFAAITHNSAEQPSVFSRSCLHGMEGKLR